MGLQGLRKEDRTAERVHEADALRDAKNWEQAAAIYTSVLEIAPNLSGIWVQLGHCLKEAGNLQDAERAYFEALSLMPNDADLHLQLGHLDKMRGRLEQAAHDYSRCLSLDPASRDAARELETLRMQGIRVPIHRPAPTVDASIEALKSHDFRTRHAGQAADVTIVGKFGTSNGIALHAHAFTECLKDFPLDLQKIDTRPEQSDPVYKTNSPVGAFATPDAARPSFVSVYCDVIANSELDANTSKVSPSLIRIAYAVFDSSLIPSYWVTRLNAFDAVAVPDECLVDVLLRSGVVRPVFVLPLALDYAGLDLQKTEPEKRSRPSDQDHEPFTFGCVAGFGERKNLTGLIAAFREAFGPGDDVVLRIHSTLNFSNAYEKIVSDLTKDGITNIIVSCSELSELRYARLFNSFDAYVSASKGEGFSITPRQALYLGMPTIISDNTAHKTIVKSGLVIGIPTAAFEVARFEAMDDLECGYQCVPSHDDLVGAFRSVLRNHARYKARAGEMRAFAQKYAVGELRWHYGALVAPKNVFLSGSNSVERSFLTTNDHSLYEKYCEWEQVRRHRVPVPDRQRISVVGHDGGFFSVFNTYLSHLVWNQGRPEVTSIVPDWRVSRILKHRGLSRFNSFCYGSRSDGNLWLKFCYPVGGMDVTEDDYDNSDFLERAIVYDDFNQNYEPNLTFVHAYKLYKDANFSEWRRWYHLFFAKHIRFRDRITAEVETFKANHFDADFVIGCHVRHPSHGIEQPGRSMPTVELYQRLIVDRSAGLRNWKVFLATDQASVVDSFRNLFGDRLIFRPDVARVNAEHDVAFGKLSAPERAREGHQIQHLTAADESLWSTRMGDEVIVDTLLLAACDAFIHVTSNIATAVAFMNPRIEMIYCE